MQTTSQKWLIFFSTSLLLVLMNFDATAVNLALAPIAIDLHLSLTNVQWIISSYLIGGAALVIIGGLLGDIYGHKKIFMLGAIIFSLASTGVGLAHSEYVVIAMRLIQGFGAAFAWPLAIVIVRKTFSDRPTFAIGLITGVMGFSMSIGPPLGGIILDYFGWRWIFLINIPLGLLVLIIAYLCLPNDANTQRNESIHIPSSILLVVGLLSLIFSLNEFQYLGIDSILIWISFIIGILFLGLFFYLQRKIATPLIDLKLITHKVISNCIIIRFFWQFVWIGIFLVLSLLLQNILDYSSLTAGGIFFATTISYALASPLGGKLLDYFSPRALLISAFIIESFCFIWFASLSPNSATWQLVVILFFFGLSFGIGFPALFNTTLALTPENRRGQASGILYGMVFFGGSVGAIIYGTLLNLLAPAYLNQHIQTMSLNFDSTQYQLLKSAVTGVRKVSSVASQILSYPSHSIEKIIRSSFYHAMTWTMILSLGCALLMIFFSWRVNPRQTHQTLP